MSRSYKDILAESKKHPLDIKKYGIGGGRAKNNHIVRSTWRERNFSFDNEDKLIQQLSSGEMRLCSKCIRPFRKYLNKLTCYYCSHGGVNK